MTDQHAHTDAILLQRLREGNHLSYRELFDRHWQRTYNAVYKRLKDHKCAEDITQDIFMNLWLRRDLVEIDNLPAYLATAARYGVYRAMEQQQVFVPVEDLVDVLRSSTDNADAPLLIKEFFLAFEEAVGGMPPARQQIFRMRYIEGLTPEEIAERLNISPKTVRNQLGRALSAFKMFSTVLLYTLW